MATAYEIVSDLGKGIVADSGSKSRDERLQLDAAFRQSEIDRANKVIADREAAGLDTSNQNAYISKILGIEQAQNTAPYVSKSVNAKAPTRIGGSTLAKDYGITQDFSAIEEILMGAVDAAYQQRLAEQDLIERDYYRGLGTNQVSLLEGLKSGTKSSTVSGVGRGLAAAQQISLALGLGQQSVDATTKLAQDRAGLADKYQTDKAATTQAALTESNVQGGVLGKLAADLFGYDTSRYSAELGAASNDYASAMGYLAQKYASDKALEGQGLASDATLAAAIASRSGSGDTDVQSVASILRDAYGSEIWNSLTPAQQEERINYYLFSKDPNFSSDIVPTTANSPADWQYIGTGMWQNRQSGEVVKSVSNPALNYVGGGSTTSGSNKVSPSSNSAVDNILGGYIKDPYNIDFNMQ